MLHRKDRILVDAISLLDEGGIQGLTTRKIAERQEISEPAIYRQYKNKLDIIMHIIEEYANYDDQIMNTISEMKMNPKDALVFYTNRYAEHYENYPEITTVMYSFDTYRYEQVTNERMTAIYKNRQDFLESVAKEGIEEGVFRGFFTAEEIAETVSGLLFADTHRWRTFGGFSLSKSVTEKMEKLLEVF